MFVAVADDFFDHPKAKRLCFLLKDKRGWAYMVLLWRWCMHYAQDGDLSRFKHGELEEVVGWTGEEGAFIAMAIEAGLLDDEPLRVHDWTDHVGKWVAKWEADRRRKEAERLAKRTVQGPSAELPRTVHGASKERR